MLPDVLVAATKNLQTLNSLTHRQQKAVNSFLRSYVEQAKLLQVQKLMANAVHYVHEGKVNQKAVGHWVVAGRHGGHHVLLKNGALECDCDLFNGRQQYAGRAGECSHIQAVTLQT